MPGTLLAGQQRMLSDLEGELRPLLAAIRSALNDLLAASGHDSLDRFLSVAPVEACVRLADTWAMAAGIGLDPHALKERFSPEEQFLIELVTAIYTAGHPACVGAEFDDLPELMRLLDETAEPVV